MKKKIIISASSLLASLIMLVFLSYATAERKGLKLGVEFPESLYYLGTSLTKLPDDNGIVWAVSLDPDVMAVSPFYVFVTPWGQIVETDLGNDLTCVLKKIRKQYRIEPAG
jgi:hypothetical protein